MANPLLALLDPRKPQSAAELDDNGNPVPATPWSQDLSDNPNYADSGVGIQTPASAPTDLSAGTDRNAATVDVLAKALGVPTGYNTTRGPLTGPEGGVQGPSSGIVGFNSQQSLQDASDTADAEKRKDQQATFEQGLGQQKQKADADLLQFFSPGQTSERNVQQGEKVELAKAPNVQAGVNSLADQQLKNKGTLDVAGVKAQTASMAQASKDWAASHKLTPQNQSKAQAAGAGLDNYNQVQALLSDPDVAPNIGPLAGRVLGSEQGLGFSGVGLSDTQAAKFAELRSKLGILAAQAGMAQGSGRGAITALLEQSAKGLKTTQSMADLQGALKADHDLLMATAFATGDSRDPATGAVAPAKPQDPMGKMLNVKPPLKFDFNGNPIP